MSKRSSIGSYVRTHPISFKSLALSFAVVGGISCVLWFMVLTGYGAESAAQMLTEQDARAWLELFASISLLYLSLKIAFHGPILDYYAKDVRLLGTYAGNAALAVGAAYLGVVWGALLPIVVLNPPMPDGLTVPMALAFAIQGLAALLFLYCFYLALYVNGKVLPVYGTPMHARVIRILAAPLALALFGRSVLRLLLVLFPQLATM